ncbi:hypothetical protein FB451DRAFT_696506 [Mycena latifolia]|nr:hypothetical protein FB451DRAFT_696506 [Mycena latifolia]
MHSTMTQQSAPRAESLHSSSSYDDDSDTASLDGGVLCTSNAPSYGTFATSGQTAVSPRPEEHVPRHVSLVLENCGSVARDHLASERTFLAYVRTSLTIASAGVALAQLLTLSEGPQAQLRVLATLTPFEIYARPLAVASILLGIYVLLVGTSRYFTIQSALVRGFFPVVRFRLGVIAFAMAAMATLLFGLLVAERPERERGFGVAERPGYGAGRERSYGVGGDAGLGAHFRR